MKHILAEISVKDKFNHPYILRFYDDGTYTSSGYGMHGIDCKWRIENDRLLFWTPDLGPKDRWATTDDSDETARKIEKEAIEKINLTIEFEKNVLGIRRKDGT